MSSIYLEKDRSSRLLRATMRQTLGSQTAETLQTSSTKELIDRSACCPVMGQLTLSSFTPSKAGKSLDQLVSALLIGPRKTSAAIESPWATALLFKETTKVPYYMAEHILFVEDDDRGCKKTKNRDVGTSEQQWNHVKHYQKYLKCHNI